MKGQRSSLVGLAVFACAVAVGARPTSDPVGAARNASLATCPHVMNTLAAPKEISDRWYVYEIVANVPESPVERRVQTHCLRYDISVQGQQLSVVANVLVNGSLNQRRNFTYSSAPSGRWQTSGLATNEGFFAGLSSDGHLLLMCETSEDGQALSTALGRASTSPTAVQLEAARRPLARNAQRAVVSPDLRHCAPPRP